MGASSRTETSVPSLKEMRVEPAETCRTCVTASPLMYVEASSALKWSTTHFATSAVYQPTPTRPDTRVTRKHLRSDGQSRTAG